MTAYQNSPLLDQLTLGKKTDYASEYNASLLQAVPRSLNRDQLSLANNALPFVGEDVWYGYELSWLNNKGKPQVALAEFRIPCTSDCLIESKSFKLYLNSFNQTRFDSQQTVLAHLIQDLSNCAKAPVGVILYPVDACQPLEFNNQAQAYTCIDELDIEIDSYQLDPALLTTENEQNVCEQLVSHLLKSNCLITNQPDWASVYISYQGAKISHEALLKYLISFRQHNEFHEQCVERIFCDLMQYCQPEQLTVYARYTRRGGLDINPFRSTELTNAPAMRTLRQ